MIVSGNLTFYLTPTKLIVCTKFQTFLLKEKDYYWKKKMHNLRGMVQVNGGDIVSIDTLYEWLVVRDENGNVKGCCIEMIPYRKEWL